VYILGILLNIVFGLLFVGFFTTILDTQFTKLSVCKQINDAKITEIKARWSMCFFAFTPFFYSIVILLDAYRRFLNSGKAELAISKKKMAMQFFAMLFLGLAEGYLTFKYLIQLFHHSQKEQNNS
jgi:hypothetical protein